MEPNSALARRRKWVELWKWRRGVHRSTGGAFVLPLAVGIAVGRLGCFFSGLADYTYGAPARVPCFQYMPPNIAGANWATAAKEISPMPTSA